MEDDIIAAILAAAKCGPRRPPREYLDQYEKFVAMRKSRAEAKDTTLADFKTLGSKGPRRR